jgi:hypothetical protein
MARTATAQDSTNRSRSKVLVAFFLLYWNVPDCGNGGHRPVHTPPRSRPLHPHPLARRSPTPYSDHYQGITHSWTQPIFASKVTKQLLLTKYSKLDSIVTVLPLRQWITLSEAPLVEALAFDSNHMAGSVMVLLKISGQYYLHTGDMRFSPKIAHHTPEVFTPDKGDEFRCRFPI